MANSAPVVVASDQTAVPVSAASLPLPTGAATGTKQDTGNTSLASIDGKITAVNTGAVVISSSALPTGAATAANQTTGNTSLATIATNTGNAATLSAQIGGGQKTQITDSGTNSAGIVVGDTGYNGVATASATKTLTFTTSSAGAQTLLANTNVEGYSWVEIVYTSVGVGLALTAPFSTVSGGTYVATSSWQSSTNSSFGSLGATVNIIYSGPIHGNYMQLAVSALTSGTFTGTVILRATPPGIGTISANQAGTWTVQPGNTVNTTPWLITPVGATASNGYTPYSYISAANTNATNVKASAGVIGTLVAMNTSASAKYIHIYNSASAPTAGTGTPIQRYLVPAGGGFTLPAPLYFSSGIGFTITGGAADADTTSTAVSDVLLNIGYA